MKTSFSNVAITRMVIVVITLLLTIGKSWIEAGIGAACVMLLLWSFLFVLFRRKMFKRIELTMTELSVTYPFFPFRTFWHSYKEYNGVVVVDIDSRIIGRNIIGYNQSGRHLYFVKDNRLKIDLCLSDFKNAYELEKELEKHLPYLAHVKSYGYFINPGKLVY
ncbi:MAG: hypothetical protein K6F89_02995 [Prevotella sp.]|nr:hypothetical protein [Prevotella sp.]